jgi:hypothetical protein
MSVAARFLNPGGTLYVVDSIGVDDMLEENDRGELVVFKEYAHGRGPQRFNEEGDYADPDTGPFAATYQTDHTVGDVVTAAVASGLRVQWVHDHVGLPWRKFPSMTGDAAGWWRLSPPYDTIPLTFSMMATK